MINKIQVKYTSDIPVMTEKDKKFVYINSNYKQILNNYYVEGHSRHGYREDLYTYLDSAYNENRAIKVCEVIDSKHVTRMVYIDYSGIRPYDIPIECFRMSPEPTKLNLMNTVSLREF